MLIARITVLAGLALAAAAFAAAPAEALTTKECSDRYQAAKVAGSLGNMTWNVFQKAECGAGASADIAKPVEKTAAKDDNAKGLTTRQCSVKYQAAKTAGILGDMKWNEFRRAECGPGASAEIDQADAAKGLSMKDCSVKYQAAKTAGTLGSMKWNEFRKAECGPGAIVAAETTGPLSIKECSVKYQQAKTDGTLGDLKWNSFRKAKCSADAAEDETVPAPDEATYTKDPPQPKTKAPRGVKFPRAIASKYSSESRGRARMHTCLDQYYANKESNSLGGLKWIQKGGGFYSLCNARLKAGA